MKKLLPVILILAVLIQILFGVTAVAADVSVGVPIFDEHTICNDGCCSATPHVTFITEQEAEQSLNSSSSAIHPRYTFCCTPDYQLTWRTTEIWHIFPQGGGYCLSIAYIGDKVCTRCGAIWESGIVYNQTSGCGQYHY